MIRLFISYSHADENYRNELQKHLMSLQHQGIIESWHDRCLTAGDEWANNIDNELQSANIILLLISSDFIASHNCYEHEMEEALARHQRGDAVVIPVILRPCHWTCLPFGKLQAATRDGKAAVEFTSLDDAFLEITQSIEKVAKQWIGKSNKLNSTITSDLYVNNDYQNSQKNILPRAEFDKKEKLYIGTQGDINAGVVTTSQNHLNGTTKEIGYTIDDASATPAGDFIEVFVGNGAKNNGVVTSSPNHLNDSTRSVGYLSIKPIKGGTKLYTGTQGNCNEGVVTTSIGHLHCSTEFIGYTLPR